MDNLYETVNKVLSHKDEIIINNCDDPKNAAQLDGMYIDVKDAGYSFRNYKNYLYKTGITILYKRFFLVACW